MACTLGRVGKCKAAGEDFQKSVTETRIDSIQSASRRIGDGLHQELEGDSSIQIHRKCASLYTSKSLVERVEKGRSDDTLSEARHAKLLRSDDPVDDSGMNFDFKTHCLFCMNPSPCKLPCEYDAKVPLSRRKSACLVRSDVDKNGRAVTNVIIAKCCERNDSLGHVVKARVESMCQSDLHAADARYHRACKTIFMYKCDKVNDNEPEDPPFLALADTLCSNRATIWNSVELHQEYEENGGTIITDRYILIRKINNHFKDAIIVLSSPGIACIVSFASETTKLFHLLKKDENDDEIDAGCQKLHRKYEKKLAHSRRRERHIQSI